MVSSTKGGFWHLELSFPSNSSIFFSYTNLIIDIVADITILIENLQIRLN